MCDISREENKAINTQLVMNHIPLNSDVLHVIKSFIFHDKTVYAKHLNQQMEQKQRKDAIIYVINSPIDFDGDIGGYYMFENPQGHGKWSIWLPIITINLWNHLQLEGSNCLKCGKYTWVKNLELERVIMEKRNIFCVNGQH